MAEQAPVQKAENQRVANLFFPPPPPFYKHFTAENIARVKDLRAEAAASTDSQENRNEMLSARLLELPSELRYLIPPQQPADGIFRAFGEIHNVNAPSVSMPDGIEKLYPSSTGQEQPGSEWTLDRAAYLKKMAQAMLLNFLELTGIMANNPAEFGDKLMDMNTLLVNMHQLINEYRPHQARETLIQMMEEQLERKKAEVEGIKRMREKVDAILEGLKKQLPEPDGESQKDDLLTPEELVRAEQLSAWQALEEEIEV